MQLSGVSEAPKPAFAMRDTFATLLDTMFLGVVGCSICFVVRSTVAGRVHRDLEMVVKILTTNH